MPSTPICLHARASPPPPSGIPPLQSPFRPDGVIYCYQTLEHIKHFITWPNNKTEQRTETKKKNNDYGWAVGGLEGVVRAKGQAARTTAKLHHSMRLDASVECWTGNGNNASLPGWPRPLGSLVLGRVLCPCLLPPAGSCHLLL